MVSEYPAISRPKERVSQIAIPGRSGVLMLPESDLPVYEPVLRTAQCRVRPDADIDAICAWLQGSGSVVFGNEPDRSYDARIINQIDFSKILRGRGFRSFAVPFQCQPYKRLYPPAEEMTLTASGMTMHNPGTVPAWPKFTLYGSGTINPDHLQRRDRAERHRQRHRAGLGGTGVHEPGRRDTAQRQGRRRPAVSASWGQRNQLDGDGGKTGSDTELAVFITIATFQKPLSFAIIGMGKKVNNFEFIEDTIDN